MEKIVQKTKDLLVGKADFYLPGKIEPENIHKIRGYFGNLFRDNPLFHNHGDNDVIYRYPLVQYKFIDKNLSIVALDDAVKPLFEAFSKTDMISIDKKEINIQQKDFKIHKHLIAVSKNYLIYRFVTPYFALNQDNYIKYELLKDKKEKQNMLNKILIGNILSFLKFHGFWVEEKVYADIYVKDITEVMFKGKSMLGITGEFATNIKLPDYIGLGKAVSLGHGTILQRRNNKND